MVAGTATLSQRFPAHVSKTRDVGQPYLISLPTSPKTGGKWGTPTLFHFFQNRGETEHPRNGRVAALMSRAAEIATTPANNSPVDLITTA